MHPAIAGIPRCLKQNLGSEITIEEQLLAAPDANMIQLLGRGPRLGYIERILAREAGVELAALAALKPSTPALPPSKLLTAAGSINSRDLIRPVPQCEGLEVVDGQSATV